METSAKSARVPPGSGRRRAPPAVERVRGRWSQRGGGGRSALWYLGKEASIGKGLVQRGRILWLWDDGDSGLATRGL